MSCSWTFSVTIPSIETFTLTGWNPFLLQNSIDFPSDYSKQLLYTSNHGSLWAKLTPGEVRLLKAETGSTVDQKYASCMSGAEVTSVIKLGMKRNLPFTWPSCQMRSFQFRRGVTSFLWPQWPLCPYSACPGMTNAKYQKGLTTPKQRHFNISYI